MSQNRYVVTMDFYLFSDDDKRAVKMAKKIADKLNELYLCDDDNSNYAVTSIVEQPFGTIGNREVYKP